MRLIPDPSWRVVCRVELARGAVARCADAQLELAGRIAVRRHHEQQRLLRADGVPHLRSKLRPAAAGARQGAVVAVDDLARLRQRVCAVDRHGGVELRLVKACVRHHVHPPEARVVVPDHVVRRDGRASARLEAVWAGAGVVHELARLPHLALPVWRREGREDAGASAVVLRHRGRLNGELEAVGDLRVCPRGQHEQERLERRDGVGHADGLAPVAARRARLEVVRAAD